MFKKIMIGLGILLVIVVLLPDDDSSISREPVKSANAASVRSSVAVGCLTTSDLQRFIRAAESNDASTADSLMFSQGKCSSISGLEYSMISRDAGSVSFEGSRVTVAKIRVQSNYGSFVLYTPAKLL